MATEPSIKRTVAFFDGQNLLYAGEEGVRLHLAELRPAGIDRGRLRFRGWTPGQTCFYTGLPSVRDDRFWNHFWTAKLASMGKRGIHTFSRHLKYPTKRCRFRAAVRQAVLVGQEKGIDIRIALDVVRMARKPVRRGDHFQPGPGPFGGGG